MMAKQFYCYELDYFKFIVKKIFALVKKKHEKIDIKLCGVLLA